MHNIYRGYVNSIHTLNPTEHQSSETPVQQQHQNGAEAHAAYPMESKLTLPAQIQQYTGAEAQIPPIQWSRSSNTANPRDYTHI